MARKTKQPELHAADPIADHTVRAPRKCIVLGCEQQPVSTLVDRFDVAGVKSVAFYDFCFHHASLIDTSRKPAPGHEKPELRKIQ